VAFRSAIVMCCRPRPLHLVEHRRVVRVEDVAPVDLPRQMIRTGGRCAFMVRICTGRCGCAGACPERVKRVLHITRRDDWSGS